MSRLYPSVPVEGISAPWTRQMWNVRLHANFSKRRHYISGHISLNLCSFLVCVLIVEVTLALLDAANDKDSEVQEQVRKSMLTLGKQKPDRVLAMCQDYLLKHPKVKRHRWFQRPCDTYDTVRVVPYILNRRYIIQLLINDTCLL